MRSNFFGLAISRISLNVTRNKISHYDSPAMIISSVFKRLRISSVGCWNIIYQFLFFVFFFFRDSCFSGDVKHDGHTFTIEIIGDKFGRVFKNFSRAVSCEILLGFFLHLLFFKGQNRCLLLFMSTRFNIHKLLLFKTQQRKKAKTRSTDTARAFRSITDVK